MDKEDREVPNVRARIMGWPRARKTLMLALVSACLMAPNAHATANGGISGTVTAAVTKVAIGGIEACAYESVPPYSKGCQKTSGAGEYTIGELAPGSYSVYFLAPSGSKLNYIGKSYASAVSVISGATTSRIDAALAVGAEVSGKVVTAGAKAAIKGIEVCAYAVGEPEFEGFYANCVPTNATGEYVLAGLLSGEYTIEFFPESGSGLNYLRQYFSGKQTYEEADVFHLTAGSAKTGVNATMAPGGGISGRVIDASTNAPITGLQVCAYPPLGGEGNCALSGASGAYTIPALPTGSYRVSFERPYESALNYLTQYYRQTENYYEATPVAVKVGSVTPSIDAAMKAGGTISGMTITAGSKTPIPHVRVCVSGSTFGCATTGSGGEYEITALPTGTYSVEFFGTSEYAGEFYNGKRFSSEANQVTVTAGSGQTGVSAELQPASKFTGSVTSLATSLPLEAIYVCAYPANQVLAAGCAYTNAQGEYALEGLYSGEYKLGFSTYSSNYLSQFYRGRSSLAEAEVIKVGTGETKTAINAALQVGGQITGVVTAAASKLPLSGASVTLYSSAGIWMASTTTNTNGEYSLARLTTGAYKVGFNATSQNFAGAYYEQKSSLAEAASVSVTTGATTGSINATLQTGGSIKGTVTDATSKAPLSGVGVQLDTMSNEWVASETSNAKGEYAFKGLREGSYKLQFNRSGYEIQYYNDKSSWSEASPIAVTAGNTTEAIDAAMHSFASIAGTVTDAETHSAVANVMVCDYPQGGSGARCSLTDASGHYSFSGLTAGSYKIQFFPEGNEYLGQYYENKQSLTEATPVAVAQGQEVVGINAALQLGGRILGSVTSKAGGLPLSGIEVCAESTGEGFFNCTTSGAGGNYALGGLPTGSYRVAFRVPFESSLDYLTQYYNGVGKRTEANAVSVTAGAATEGVDAAMLAGGEIHGVVTSLSKTPLANAQACASEPAGKGETYRCATTNSSGEYAITSLPTGKYVVYFNSYEGEYSSQIYKEAANEAEATRVGVTTGAATTGIDGQLHARGRISGTVTSAASGKPVAGVSVCVLNAQGSFEVCTSSGTNGEYTLSGVTAGPHKVEFRSNSLAYETQYYNGKAQSSEADGVEVKEAAITEGIDAAMVTPGEITGKVTAEGSGAGIAGIQVCTAFSVRCATTGANGEYTIGGVRAGSYKVNFYAPHGLNYVFQYYPGKSRYEEAESVTVTADAATGNINATLAIGGRISGRVATGKSGTALAGIQVCPWIVTSTSSGTGPECATTSANGEYVLEKLATGEYEVGFADPSNSSLNFIQQFYNARAHLSEGQKLAITAGANTSGIDATLEPGGEVSGTVTRIGNKAPLNEIEVCPWVHGGFESVRPAPCVLTNAAGEYTLRGLPPGLVDVEFHSFKYVGGEPEFFTQYYKEASQRSGATGVPVEVLHVTTKIDGRLKATHPIVPELVSVPTISGTPQQGVTLSAQHGSWTNEAIEYQYLWYSCSSLGLSCLPISHAEGQSYTPVAMDVGSRLEVQETATNLEGKSQPAMSAMTAVTTPAKPVNLYPPTVTGSAQAGQTVQDTRGGWTNEPIAYTYQWERCDKIGENCTFVAGETGASYNLSSADVGHTIRVIETAINAGGESAPAVSSQSLVVVPETPVNISPPSIAGSAVQGNTLSESHGVWTNEPTNSTYQWERCASNGKECSPIAGASGSSYTLISGDVGHTIVVAETAGNAGGAGKPAQSEPTLEVLSAAPVNTAPPAISGYVRPGATLSEEHGHWTNEPIGFSYQWMRCTAQGAECKAIPGATEQAYVLEPNDVGQELAVEETARNAGGQGAGATSTPTAVVVVGAPVNATPPAVTGTPRQGERLEATHGSWTNEPTSYQIEWQRCDSAGENCIGAGGGSEYLLSAQDLGHTIRAVETASNAGGPGNPAPSAPTARVVAAVPVNTVPPTVSGPAVQNETLIETHGDWTNEPSTYGYQWERCSSAGAECSPIAGATAQVYVLTAADVGHRLVVAETAHNAGGVSQPQSSVPTALISPPVPVNTAPPKISGKAQVGSTLTAEQGAWTNSPATYNYRWERCNVLGLGCLPITGATHQSYAPEAVDLGSTLVVEEIAHNTAGQSAPAASASIGPVVAPPPVNTAPPTITGSPESGETLRVSHGAWTNNPTEYREQWLRCNAGGGGCGPIHSAIQTTYAPAAADVGHSLEVEEIAGNAGGLGEPASSAPTKTVVLAPLHARAGENIETTTATAVTFDGSGSTPASEITGAGWDFGDGSSGVGKIVHHAYGSPGKYTAMLTVERGGETSEQAISVLVKTPHEHEVTITAQDEGKHPLAGVEVFYNGPSGSRIEAITDAAGKAVMANLPDGPDTVDLYKEGYKPSAGIVNVSGGAGEATIALSAGAIGEAHLTSHEMTLKEIEKAEIDTSDPSNNNVYQFEVVLHFEHITCQLNANGEFVGLESCSGGGGGSGSGGGGAGGGLTWTPHGGCGERVCIAGEIVHGHPIIETLVLQGKVTTLKQFFAVSMTISNLSPEPFKFTNGEATINVPNGMSLAPTPTPQNQTNSVPDIPGEGSAETSWIVRGDTPGAYYLSASYHAQLEPFEAPIELLAATATPLKVWGAEALALSVQADDSGLREGVPYHVTVAVTNKAQAPLYNVDLAMDESAHSNFIFQPAQRFHKIIAELRPGQTLLGSQLILVPDANSAGKFNPSLSSATFVGQQVHPGEGIEAVTPPPLYSLTALTDTPFMVHLHWQPVPGAEGYEVFPTPNLDTGFAEGPEAVMGEASAPETVTQLPSSATDAFLPGDPQAPPRYYAVSALINGQPMLEAPVISATAGSPPPPAPGGGVAGYSGGAEAGSEQGAGAPTPSPTCAGLHSIAVKGVTVQSSCLTKVSRGLFTATGSLRVNGIDIKASGQVRLNTNTLELDSTGSVEVFAGSALVYRGQLSWKFQATLTLGIPAGATLKGLPLSGQATVSLIPGGAKIVANAVIKGGSVQVTGKVTLELALQSGLKLNGLTVELESNIPLKGIVVKKAKLGYHSTKGREIWEGAIEIELPAKLPTVKGYLVITNGQISFVEVVVSKLNKYIAYGVFLQELGMKVVIKPPGITGLIGLSAGPNVLNHTAASLKGSLGASFGSPVTIEARGSLQLVNQTMYSAWMKVKFPGGVAFGGEENRSIGPVGIRGMVAGQISSNEFEAQGRVTLSAKVASASGLGLVNTEGLAGCATARALGQSVQIGGWYRWNGEKGLLNAVCGFSQLRAAVARARLAGATIPVTVPAGARQVNLAVRGDTGPPSVTLTAAGQTAVVAPDTIGRVGRAVYVAIGDPQEAQTYVAIVGLPAGALQVSSAVSGSKITSVASARALPGPAVQVAVQPAGGRRFRLRWSARPIPGQTLLFEDVDSRGQTVVVKTTKPHGHAIFSSPQDGATGHHTLRVVVQQYGFTRETAMRATFTPASLRLAAPHVKLRIVHGTGRLTWRAVAGAAGYQISVQTSDGRQLYFHEPPRVRSLRVSHVKKIRATVQALGPALEVGPAARAGYTGNAS